MSMWAAITTIFPWISADILFPQKAAALPPEGCFFSPPGAAKKGGPAGPPFPVGGKTDYIMGSIPRAGWPFSVRNSIRVSGSSAMVSSPIMSQKLSMP